MIRTKDVKAKDMKVGYVWDNKTVVQVVIGEEETAILFSNDYLEVYNNERESFILGIQPEPEEDYLIKTDFETVDSIRCAETIMEIIDKHNAFVKSLKEMK